jgi:hypothetical protein
LTSRESRVFLGVVKKKPIGLECLLRTSARGDGLYLYVPQDICTVYGIMAGDRIKTRLVERFRLVSEVEQEAKDRAHEARVEPTLVIPKQRRHRRKPNLDSDSDTEPQESTEKEDGIDEGES